MRTANRAAMNWKTIGAQYTVFDEDLKDTVFLEDTLSNGGKTGKNVITSESYANHEPSCPKIQASDYGIYFPAGLKHIG